MTISTIKAAEHASVSRGELLIASVMLTHQPLHTPYAALLWELQVAPLPATVTEGGTVLAAHGP